MPTGDDPLPPPRRGAAARTHPPTRLTKRFIETLAAPAGCDYVVMDALLRGFGVRVTHRGAVVRKAFFLGYRRRDTGETRRLTLGAFGPLSVEDARAMAMREKGRVAQGEDPSGDRGRARAERTIAAVGADYLAHVRLRRKGSTAEEYARLWERHVLPVLGRKRVPHIDATDVRRLHASMAETPYQANRVLAMLGAFFTFAEAQGARLKDGKHPTRGVEHYPETSRERFLSPAEVARIGDALTTAETVGLPPAPSTRKPKGTKRPQNRAKSADVPKPANPLVVAAIRLLVLTGCREHEVLTLRWDAVDLERGFLRLADTKTGKNVRPLGAAAAELLEALPRLQGSPYVFPGAKRGQPIRDVARLWYAVRHAAELPDVRLHDLRHSYAAVSAIGGDSLLVTRALLGHRDIATTQRYAHLSDDPVKAAADRASGSLAAWLSGRQTPVTPIRKGSA